MKVSPIYALCFVFLWQAILAAQDMVEESPYYPLKVGTAWHYKLGDAPLVVRVAKHEKIGDILCAGIETEVGGMVRNHEHIGLNKEGVVRHSFNSTKIEPPVVILKLPPKDGDAWDINSKAGGLELKATFKAKAEKIEVPAGKYDAITVTVEHTDPAGNKVTTIHSYAKDFGLVKQVIQSKDRNVTIDLQKFEAGK